MNFYYIYSGDAVEGPFDMPAMLRKIRSGKVNADTYLRHASQAEPSQARDIPEIAPIVSHRRGVSGIGSSQTAQERFVEAMATGGRFFNQCPVFAALAGLLVLLCLLAAILLGGAHGVGGVWLVAALLLLLFQPLMLVVGLRLFRGQPADLVTLKGELKPVLLPFTICGAVSVLAVAMGSLVLLLPGVLAHTLLVFTPFVLLDRRMNALEALKSSANAALSDGADGFGAVFGLGALHLLSVLLILPLPLVLPIIVGGLAELYDRSPR